MFVLPLSPLLVCSRQFFPFKSFGLREFDFKSVMVRSNLGSWVILTALERELMTALRHQLILIDD